MSKQLEVLALDCTEATTHTVHLAVAAESESPISLLEQKSFPEYADFYHYWLRMLKRGSPLIIVAEDNPNDPHLILGLVEQRLPVDRQYLHYLDMAYKEPLEKLRITWACSRAGSLALNKAHQVIASESARKLMAVSIELNRQLKTFQMEASRLYLALNSSIYSISKNF